MRYLKFVLILSFLACSTAMSQALIHTEILGKPTDNSITVRVIFSEQAEVCAQYGTSSGSTTSRTDWKLVAANEPADVIIDGLQPNTKYFYKLCHRSPNSSTITNRDEYSFQTQRPAGVPFTFIVQADPHLDEQSDSTLYRLCLKNQLEDKPDFMIDLGDIIMTDKLKNSSGKITHDTIISRCKLMRSYYETVCHSLPLYMVLGNHEGEAGWQLNANGENIAVWGSNERKKYYTNPTPNNFYTGDTTNHKYIGLRENYYAWNWGDALFVVLDPYWYTSPKPDSMNGWRWTLGKIQYEWLRTTLEKSKAKFKFIFCHQLVGGDPDGRGGIEFANLYEWGGNNLDGSRGFEKNRPGWYKPIKDILTENRVNIFFHGHDHFFGKQEKDCLIYQEVPQPSHPNFSNAGQAKGYGYIQGQILPNSGHIRVSVAPSGVKIDYVRAYLQKNESPNRKNRDVSATYFIGEKNCYDSIATGVPVLWNSNYADELVYPNPFIKETKIEFSLNKSDNIFLSILDEKGNLVRKLIDNSLVQPGKYQIIFDGKDAYGYQLPAGVYWYRISGEGQETQGKIIITR